VTFAPGKPVKLTEEQAIAQGLQMLISELEKLAIEYTPFISKQNAYVVATSLTFAYAIIGAQVFRGKILGTAWGLLLLGIGLNWVADIQYYFFSITYFDRSSPVHGIWLGGAMIVCYALYKHKKHL